MIIKLTTLQELPKTCVDCYEGCGLPMSLRDYTKVLKPYCQKRHPKCPLRELTEAQAKEVGLCK